MGENSGSFFLSWRFALSMIGFFGFVHVYAQRVGMSVAIVCMVNHTALQVSLHDHSERWKSVVKQRFRSSSCELSLFVHNVKEPL